MLRGSFNPSGPCRVTAPATPAVLRFGTRGAGPAAKGRQPGCRSCIIVRVPASNEWLASDRPWQVWVAAGLVILGVTVPLGFVQATSYAPTPQQLAHASRNLIPQSVSPVNGVPPAALANCQVLWDRTRAKPGNFVPHGFIPYNFRFFWNSARALADAPGRSDAVVPQQLAIAINNYVAGCNYLFGHPPR